MPPPTVFARLRSGAELSRVQDQVASVVNPVAQAVGTTPMLGAAPPAWLPADLLNGFTWVGGTTAQPSSHLDALRYVHTRGFAINNTGGLLTGVPVLRLPSGSWPAVDFIQPASAQGSIFGTGFNITVTQDGFLIPDDVPNGDSFSWYFSFLAEQ